MGLAKFPIYKYVRTSKGWRYWSILAHLAYRMARFALRGIWRTARVSESASSLSSAFLHQALLLRPIHSEFSGGIPQRSVTHL